MTSAMPVHAEPFHSDERPVVATFRSPVFNASETFVRAQAAGLSRYVRSAVLDVMNQDYVRTARASGMTRTEALLRVGLRNAALPLITILGLQIADLIGGTVIIETVFSLPGLSRMILANVAAREVIVVQSTVMLIIIFVIAVNLIVDLLYGLLDPRVRATR